MDASMATMLKPSNSDGMNMKSNDERYDDKLNKGGLTLTFGNVTLTEVAAALILGIIINLILGGGKKSRTAEKCDK